MEGKMLVTYANGDRFEGEFKAGAKNGTGIMGYKSGAKYEGSWKDGLADGKGTFTDASGWQFAGTWKQGNPHGKGVFIISGEEKYEAEFDEGRRISGSGREINIPRSKIWHDGDDHDTSCTRDAMRSGRSGSGDGRLRPAEPVPRRRLGEAPRRKEVGTDERDRYRSQQQHLGVRAMRREFLHRFERGAARQAQPVGQISQEFRRGDVRVSPRHPHRQSRQRVGYRRGWKGRQRPPGREVQRGGKGPLDARPGRGPRRRPGHLQPAVGRAHRSERRYFRRGRTRRRLQRAHREVLERRKVHQDLGQEGS